MQSLIIDNYDSFTYNLFQMIAKINGALPLVIKNDEVIWEELIKIECDNIIISPGPGHPEKWADFGICGRVLWEINLPVLGVCLGHQGLYCAFGGKIIHAPQPMHGRISKITHQDNELFKNIPREFNVVRYHSLICDQPVPDVLEVIASSEDGLVMGIRHKSRPLWGVQFHPESIGTEYGYQLLNNFKEITKNFARRGGPTCPPAASVGHQGGHVGPPLHHYCIRVKELADFFQPPQVFQNLFSHKKNMVWLDSSKITPGVSRFSFMGCTDGPLSYSVKYHVQTKKVTVLKNQQQTTEEISIFYFLARELKKFSIAPLNLPFNFNCGFVGYLGYELKSETTPITNQFISDMPDAQFLFLDRVMVFDHLEKKCYLLSLTENDAEASIWFNEIEQALQKTSSIETARKKSAIPDWYLARNHHTYINDIDRCLQLIRDGESYEICLTNKMKMDYSLDPLQYYLSLRKTNPAPYSAFLKLDECAIACSSMERFLLIDPQGNIETKPIKGTLPRGKIPEEDEKLKYLLAHDEKFKAENLMIVDLLRNDMGKVCEIGSIHVPALMQVETYETVHQLVSTIRGKLNPGLSAIDCIKALFPGGSMTGAPKIRTLNMIDSLEKEARGIYSGAIGYLSLNGAADFNIVIRTAIITPEQVSIGIGGAIIALSNSEEEFEETLLKAKSLQQALLAILS